MQPQDIKLLKETIETITKGNITRSDFVAALKEIRKELIERIDSYLLKTQKDILGAVKDKIDMIESDLNKSSDAMEKMSSQKMEEIMEDCMKEISRVEAMIPEVDFTEVEKKIDNAVLEIESKIPTLPEELKGEAIVKKVNSLPIEREYQIGKEHIRDLEKEITELRETISRIGSNISGSVSNLRIQQAFKYILKTEEPVGDIDGVNVTYTLRQPIFAILSMSLNGETIAQLPNYTISGNSFTFSVALPAAYSGKDWEVKYI